MYIHTCFCRHIYTNVHACKIYLYMQAVVNGYMYNGRGALSPNERCLQATVSSSNSAAENGMDYFSSPAHLNQSAITNRTARISGGQPSWKDEWLSVLSPPIRYIRAEAHWHLALCTSTSITGCSVSCEQLCDDWFRRMVMWYESSNRPHELTISWVCLHNKNTVVDVAQTKRHF